MINSETDLFFAIGGAVLHFLWQGTVIGLIAALLIRGLHKSSAESRYAVALCSSVICVIVFLITFGGLVYKIPNMIGVLVTPITLIPIANNNSVGMQQIVATIWAIGVGLLIAKFVFHWLWSQRLRTRMVANPDGQWLEIFNELKTQMGISKSVKMLKSGLVHTPMVVGWISPVVLVPAAAFASISPEQMRMIIVHELMHIRRYDHWVNQFQALVEIILFFHPVVWWLSRQMKIEREYCCDDASLKAVPKPKLMAQTLAQLEQIKISSPANILAADGGSLMDRITRILDNRVRTKETNKHKMKIQTLGVIAAAALLVGGITNVEAEAKKTAAKKSNRPSREAIVKRFDKDGDGKLNETERKAATAALRKQSGRESDRASESDPGRQRIATARKQISDAMKAGKITEKQANERMAALRKRISQSDRASESDSGRQRIATARKQISDAMKAGEITKKQGQERMEALKKRISQSNRAIDRRQGGQGGSERGERSRSRNRDSDRRGNRASDRRQGGRGGENTERRRRGNRRGGE